MEWDDITILFYQSVSTVVVTVGGRPFAHSAQSPTAGDPGFCCMSAWEIREYDGENWQFLFANLSRTLKIFMLLRKHWKCSYHGQRERRSHSRNMSRAQASSQGNLLTQLWIVLLEVGVWNSLIKPSISDWGEGSVGNVLVEQSWGIEFVSQ